MYFAEVFEGDVDVAGDQGEGCEGEAGLEVEAGKHGGATEGEGRICLKER